jgi:hypothetical protein
MSIIGTLPYVFNNGTSADANQVDANFAAIVASVNAGAAKNGANSDITSLTGLTTPITQPQGGTGLQQFGILEGARGCLITWGTTTFTVAAGVAATTDGNLFISPTAITKSLGSWAAGSGSGVGSLDMGVVAANSWYTVWGIMNPSSATVTGDIIISAGAAGGTAPSLPSSAISLGYAKWARLGAFMTNSSSQIVVQTESQNNNRFSYGTGFQDYSTTAPTTPTLIPLTVPLGVKVIALFRAVMQSSANQPAIIFQSPDEGSQSATISNGSLIAPGTTVYSAGQFSVLTDTSGRIRINANTSGNPLSIYTFGFDYPVGQP